MQPLAAGVVIRQGDTLKTGLNSTVEVALGKGSRTVTLTPNSTARVEQLSIRPTPTGDIVQSLFRLETGSLGATADDFLPGSRLDVEMPRGVAQASSRSLRLQGPSPFCAVFNANTGDIYNFSGDAISLTVNLDIQVSNSGLFPVGTESASVNIPPGSRFVMPSSFSMDEFAISTSFGVSAIPSHITRDFLLGFGFRPMTSTTPTAEYAAAVVELELFLFKTRLGVVSFPPTLTSY
jgi:hypothetical protein